MVKALLLRDRGVKQNYAPVFSLLGSLPFIKTVDINKLLSEHCLKCPFFSTFIQTVTSVTLFFVADLLSFKKKKPLTTVEGGCTLA